LAKELPDTSIVSIPKVINSQIDVSGDCIGIIFPVYCFGVPLIVTRFIDKLKLDENKYVFTIATYGGWPGSAIAQIEKQFKAKGIKLSAGWKFVMPGNYTPLCGAIAQDKQDKMFAKEIQKVKNIAPLIKGRKASRLEKNFPLIDFLMTVLSTNLFIPCLNKEDRHFWVDSRCNGCGTCAKVCPVDNIEMSSGKPVWLHRCEQCFACLQWCPQEALQCGRKTASRKRYRNPQVTLQDFIK
jgi:ferredoxin